MDYLIASASYVYELFTPAPTTPIFQEGGLLHTFNEDLVQIISSVLLFALIDQCCIRRIVLPKARYFVLHLIANLWVCAVAFPTVVQCIFADPLKAFVGPGAIIANNIVAGLHVYHCLSFNLKRDDVLHHMTFCLTLCSVAIPVKGASGGASPFAGFFLSGLPGAIDYFVLTLRVYGYVTKGFQKELCANLNIWLRGPGACVYCYLCYITWLHVEVPYSVWVSALVTFLTFYNGQFYTQLAIQSSAVYKYRKKLEKQGVVIPADAHRRWNSNANDGVIKSLSLESRSGRGLSRGLRRHDSEKR